jgi:hypothetical protein
MTFNPRMLDASLFTAASYLTDDRKISLLLDAMQDVQFTRCVQLRCCGIFDSNSPRWCRESRVAIENMAEACLCVSSKPSQIVRARILRAKARLADGLILDAQEGAFFGHIRGNTRDSSVASRLQICRLYCQ